MKNILKVIIALMLLPVSYYGLVELWALVSMVAVTFKVAVFFIAGAAAYGAVHFFLYDFSRPYVAAHEWTHALAALFFGFKVKAVKINKNSGNVKLSDYNEAVVLAPYVVPLYFIVFLFICFVLVCNGYNGENYRNIYSLGLGFLFAFHVVQTVKTLAEASQPDLKMAGGTVFSITVIVCFNILFLMLFIALIFPEHTSLTEVFKNISGKTLLCWKKVLNYIVKEVVEIAGL